MADTQTPNLTSPTEAEAEIEVLSTVPAGMGLKITVFSKRQELIGATTTRRLVLRVAGQNGIANAGISKQPSPRPVNSERKPTEAAALGREPCVGYIGTYEVLGR